MRKMSAKTARKKLIKKLDKLCREIVFKRDGENCLICGKHGVTWSHVFSRRTYNTRWDLKNSFAHCWGCNYRHVRDQYPMLMWYEEKFGKKQLEDLRRRFKETHRWTTTDLELVEEYLES